MAFNNSAFANCCAYLNKLQPQRNSVINRQDWNSFYFDGSRIRHEARTLVAGTERYKAETSFDPNSVQKIEYRRIVLADFVYITFSSQPRVTGVYEGTKFDDPLKEIQIGFDSMEQAVQFVNLWNSAF